MIFSCACLFPPKDSTAHRRTDELSRILFTLTITSVSFRLCLSSDVHNSYFFVFCFRNSNNRWKLLIIMFPARDQTRNWTRSPTLYRVGIKPNLGNPRVIARKTMRGLEKPSIRLTSYAYGSEILCDVGYRIVRGLLGGTFICAWVLGMCQIQLLHIIFYFLLCLSTPSGDTYFENRIPHQKNMPI